MDTLSYQTIQQLPDTNPYDLLYKYLMNFIFTPEILYLVVSIFFLMEGIKYFSEGTQYDFNLNKKLYGGATLILLFALNILFGGWTNLKHQVTDLVVIVSPVFVLYNIVLKQFGEWLRNKVNKLFGNDKQG